MRKKSQIITAANTRIMNAVEVPKLFAAADEVTPAINFTSGKDLEKINLTAVKSAGKMRRN